MDNILLCFNRHLQGRPPGKISTLETYFGVPYKQESQSVFQHIKEGLRQGLRFWHCGMRTRWAEDPHADPVLGSFKVTQKSILSILWKQAQQQLTQMHKAALPKSDLLLERKIL